MKTEKIEQNEILIYFKQQKYELHIFYKKNHDK